MVELEVSSVLCGSGSIQESTTGVAEEPSVDFQSTGNRWGSMFDPTEE